MAVPLVGMLLDDQGTGAAVDACFDLHHLRVGARVDGERLFRGAVDAAVVGDGTEIAAAAGLRPRPPAASRARLATAAGHGAVDFTDALALFAVFTFVPLLFAMHECDLGFDSALLLIQRQRHQGVALLSDLAGQAVDFTPVEQQLSLAARIVVAAVREA